MTDYKDTIDTTDAPKSVNAVYNGKATIADSEGRESRSMYGVPGRAWRDERWLAENAIDEYEGERWFYLPASAPRKDGNIFLVWADNLTFTK